VAAPGPERMGDALRLEEVQVEKLGADVLVLGRPTRSGRRARVPARPGRSRAVGGKAR